MSVLLLLACFPELEAPDTLVDNPYRDYDGDGYSTIDGDCDDDDPASWPGAPEICDGKDRDCSGTVDDDCITLDTGDSADTSGS